MSVSIARTIRRASISLLAGAALMAVVASSAHAATPFAPAGKQARNTVYGSSPYLNTMQAPAASCAYSPGNSTVAINPPPMRAANVTAYTDYQNVAHRSHLYRWNGSAWALYRSGVWRYSNVSDQFGPIIWRNASGGLNDGAARFYSVPRGFYAVKVEGYHYATSRVSALTQNVWASGYAQLGVWNGYCSFPG